MKCSSSPDFSTVYSYKILARVSAIEQDVSGHIDARKSPFQGRYSVILSLLVEHLESPKVVTQENFQKHGRFDNRIGRHRESEGIGPW